MQVWFKQFESYFQGVLKMIGTAALFLTEQVAAQKGESRSTPSLQTGESSHLN